MAGVSGRALGLSAGVAGIVAGLLGVSGSARAQGVLTPLAMSGQPAPGLGEGVVLSSFVGPPVVNDAGIIAFQARVAGPGVTSANDLVVFLGPPGDLRPVLREGDTAPVEIEGVRVVEPFGLMTMNASGQIALSTELAGEFIAPYNNVLIWRVSVADPGGGAGGGGGGDVGSVGGVPEVVHWEGLQIPELQPGYIVSSFQAPFNLAINALGEVCFMAQVTGSFQFDDDEVILAAVPGLIQVAAREGGQAPDVVNGAVFGPLVPFAPDPSFNDAGQQAWSGTFMGIGVGPTNDTGIFIGPAEGASLVARESNPAPGLPGIQFGPTNNSNPVGLNAAGQVAFACLLAGNVNTSNNQAIWAGRPGQLVLVARTNTGAPGYPSGTRYTDLTPDLPVLINAQGRVAFCAGLNIPDPFANEALFAGAPGSVFPVIREGDPAPGTPAGVRFGPPSGLITNFAINSVGQVAASALLFGTGVNPSNDSGVWMTRPDGSLALLARESDSVIVGLNDVRVITSIGFTGRSGGQDGRSNNFTSDGQVGLRLTFGNNTSGLFLVRPPNPCPPDANADTMLDAFDFNVFVDAFNAGDLGNADLNRDATLDAFDFNAFVDAFNAGCE